MAVKKAASKAAAVKVVKLAKPKNGVQYNQSEFINCVQSSCEFESRKLAKEVYESFAGMIHAALKKATRFLFQESARFRCVSRRLVLAAIL